MLFFPWWVYACIIGIIFCAYKLMTTAKEEQEIDQSFIEKEGEILLNEWSRRESVDVKDSKCKSNDLRKRRNMRTIRLHNQ